MRLQIQYKLNRPRVCEFAWPLLGTPKHPQFPLICCGLRQALECLEPRPTSLVRLCSGESGWQLEPTLLPHLALLLPAPVPLVRLSLRHATPLLCNLLPLKLRRISLTWHFVLPTICPLPTAFLALSPTAVLLAPDSPVKLNYPFPSVSCAFPPLCLCSVVPTARFALLPSSVRGNPICPSQGRASLISFMKSRLIP